MRPRWQAPRNKQYFHTQRKIDKRDMAALKNKIDTVYQKKKTTKYIERYLKG